MKPIPQWRQAWRMFSVQAMSLALAIEATIVSLRGLGIGFAEAVPEFARPLVVALLVAGIIGRLVDQGIETGDKGGGRGL